MMLKQQKIAVIGAGLMGNGIAWLFADAGHPVRVFDRSPEALAAAPGRIAEISALFGRGPEVAARALTAASLAGAVGDADFIFEAAFEDVALKQALFADVERLSKPNAVLASNTSAIPISIVAAQLADKSRLVGAHFWNPPHLVPLVEVVESEWGNRAGVEATIALLKAAGRHPVHVRRDVPGFIGNRLQHALKREAIALVAAGVCDAETIDDVVKFGFGRRMGLLGPLEQSDLVGLELTKAIHDTLMPDLDRTATTHPYLLDRIARGQLGMKTGQGFRVWTPEAAAAVRERLRVELQRQAGQERDDHGRH
jgi:3-hydroxybutyryl-CoA dehydrogenase